MTDQKKFDDFRKELLSYDIHNEIVRLRAFIDKMMRALPNEIDDMTPLIAKIGEAIDALKVVEKRLFDPTKYIDGLMHVKSKTPAERC